ncbi:MAG TPA: glycosyltransferase family 39 protein [Tepidisphaeraceae bacterium]|jgi:4-amino-4-deoxy-L-arabinose transferase-like glycosyltransferase
MIRSACVLLLLIFAILSFTAARTKNSTYDETLHVPAAWAVLHGDYRANSEHPPLWKYWCALPHLIWPMNTAQASDDWKGMIDNFAYEWNWAVDVLYRTPGNDADAIVNHARFMMTLIAVGLGALLIGWTWKLGGPNAALVAAILFCFDPNFLAHGSLVTNDVAMTLCFFAWLWAIWHVGKNATPWRIAILALLCGIAMVVKFSALLLGPLTLLMLLIRAFDGPWSIAGKNLVSLSKRILAAISICLLAGAASYLIIWATYGFRYAAIADGQHPLPWQELMDKTCFNELSARHPGQPVFQSERLAWKPSLSTQLGIFAAQHHLLPESFCFGVIFVRTSGLLRSSFLLGQISPVGWWYYFPLAILFKTPTATLIAMILVLVAVRHKFRRWFANSEQRWLAIVLILPALIYLLFIMGENLDLGLRHVFEIYPPIYLGIGLAAARLNRNGKIAAGLLALLLIAETVSAYPNFIPFFNWPSGGWRNGINLLGDSNLDWGQDLKLLGQWRQVHRTPKLYLLYFGTADPAYYGIAYTNLPGSYILGPSMQLPTTPGIIAVSATDLQGIYLDDAERHAYGWMKETEPLEVFGGSLYLFQYPPLTQAQPER